MRKSNLRATAGWQALALLGAGVLAAAPAAAQGTTAPDGTTPPSSETQPSTSQQPVTAGTEGQADADDAIVVTGSRIVRPDLEAPSPVTTVSAETFDLTGTVTVESLLNELPQIIPGNTRVSNNQGGEDFSTLDLRGLGPQRTLILVDGERVPASSTTGVVDIGTIPAGLIERVDVVTGGASAVYGSDAMAGVVNFILKDNYEGLELQSQYGISDHGDGASFNVQGLLGGNFGDDRGNMTFFASYYTRESVGQGDRNVLRDASVLYYDYSISRYIVADHLTYPTASQGLAGVGGSGTPPWGWIASNPLNPFRNLSTNPATSGQFASANTDCDPTTPGVAVNGGNLSFNDAGQLTPRFNTAGLCPFADRSTGSSRFNFNPLNFLVTPYDRWNMALTGRYDINDSIRLKVIASVTDSTQTVNLAPTPATGIVVPANNAFIVNGGACGATSCHPDLLAALNSRTFFTGNVTPPTQEFGSSTSCLAFDGPDAGTAPDNTICTQQSGAARPFTMDRRFSETGPRVGDYNSKTATLRGTLSGPLAHGFNWDVTASYGRTFAVASLQGNINRTALTDGLNNCPLGSLPNCVPVDIFGPGTVVGQQLSFVRVDTKETRRFDQARIAGNITGNLVELPAGPVGIAIGAEARTDRGDVVVDDAQRTGNIYGFNATQDQHGKVNTKEVYGEVRVPILADMPFFHELSIEAGARYSDYSSVGGLFNWKLGAQWSPVEWLKFRGIYNKAARAPSIVELFQNGDQGFPGYTDPCNATPAGSRSAFELAICQAQAPAVDFSNFLQNNTQVQAFAFGNPSLTEETAKTWTVGAVLTPNLGLGRFSATIDYYNIKIDDIIATQGAGFYLANCYAQGIGSDACNRIVRDPATGQITSINTSIANGGTYKTSGVDASVNFVVPFADVGLGIPGRIRFQELISWLDKLDFGITAVPNASGYNFGSIGGTFPEWKSTLTTAYESDSFTAQLRWNYLSSTIDYFGAANDGKLPALSYFDLSLRKKIGSNFEITGIIQNLFNAKYHKTVNGDQGGVETAYYNPIILGRYFTLSAKVKM
jgi:outer membrane receptor protein involved in Fe transport